MADVTASAKHKTARALDERSPTHRRRLTRDFIDRSPALAKPYRIHDAQVPGLFVRIQPSGVRTYNVQWSRTSSKSIGKHPVMTLEAARAQSLNILADAAKNGTPEVAKARPKVSTLRDFVDKAFAPWAASHQKWGARAAQRIKVVFVDRLDKPLSDLNAWVIEKWRSRRLKDGTADATVNRDLAALKSALSKAVQWEILAVNPLHAVKLRRIDNKRVRYLDSAEEKRLRAALNLRDQAAAAARASGNAWRAARNRDALPRIAANGYADHLTPIVLLAINTGLRRGELTALQWGDVNFATKLVHVRAAAAKSGKSRHVPLNSEAIRVMTRWQLQCGAAGSVFAVRDVKTAWNAVLMAANIQGFHFHDLRHSFASRLVMAGVDLNTLRELLGHQDLAMTLRYSHLAPGHKESAVELLTAKR